MMTSFKAIKEVKDKKYAGKKVSVRGWAHRQRSGKEMAFIILRDSTGLIQCTAKAGSKVFKDVEKTTVESSIELSGVLKEDKRAPGGFEIAISEYKIIQLADPFPITKDQSQELLLDKRHLWLRSQKMTAILKIRSTVFKAIHDFYRSKGYYEFQSPIFMPVACEGGSTLFEVKYYKKKVYLSQSWQLHAEAAIFALEKIYTITPAFRAEKMKTAKHLCEYWTAEAEMAWMELDEMLKVAEEMVSYLCQEVAKKHSKELKLLGRDPEELKKIKPPFPRLKYKEVLKILEKDGMKVPFGKDLRTLEEKQLMIHYDKPVIITHYPKETMGFYKPSDPKHPDEALCFDMITHDVGELIGGSQRSTDIKAMIEALKKEGEDISRYEWYLDLRRYGSVPHSGFGFGIERFIQWICKLKSIKDAIAFPRTIERTSP